jgi:hypothetical protein
MLLKVMRSYALIFRTWVTCFATCAAFCSGSHYNFALHEDVSFFHFVTDNVVLVFNREVQAGGVSHFQSGLRQNAGARPERCAPKPA